ncbi:hypothetical protein GO491_04265 [Flavobacteriaceae bacterium Ap0902]|nr:hypothetical protein [Flavobacteriaceae bacterium Ap0902]
MFPHLQVTPILSGSDLKWFLQFSSVLTDNFHKVDFDYLLHCINTVENLDNRNLSFEQYYEEEFFLANLSERLLENEESEE